MVKTKIVKKEERCPTCKAITKYAEERFFCENCDKEMSERLNEGELQTTYFYKEPDKNGDFYFCSWKCIFEWMLKNKKKFKSKDFSFFTLPYLKNSAQNNIDNFFKSLNETLSNK